MIIINKGTTRVEGYVKDLLDSKKIKVTFEVDNIELTQNLISGSSWKDKLDSQLENRFILFVSNEEISDLVKYFVENGVKLSAVIPTRSLEDYFLKITEEAA
jgi:ABC-type multidrug transport system ATPase subunit